MAGEKAGKEKGIEKGRAEGIEQGRAEERAKVEVEKHAEKIETAKKMLSKGLNISDISDLTGLSVEKIQSL